MKNINLKKQRGFVNIIIIIVVALIILAASGLGYYFIIKKTAKLSGGNQDQTPVAVQAVTVEAPNFDFKLSPMPTLDISSVNLSAPNMPGNRIFPNFAVDSNFSYTGDTSIATPSFTFDVAAPTGMKVPSNIPSAPATQDEPAAPDLPSNQADSQTGSTDCAQFTAVPSCSYVGGAGTPGYEACKKCYPQK
ncbi:MAG: hypothetical protein WCX71_05090 [Candidatus Buchananbacteria bacterium]